MGKLESAIDRDQAARKMKVSAAQEEVSRAGRVVQQKEEELKSRLRNEEEAEAERRQRDEEDSFGLSGKNLEEEIRK